MIPTDQTRERTVTMPPPFFRDTGSTAVTPRFNLQVATDRLAHAQEKLAQEMACLRGDIDRLTSAVGNPRRVLVVDDNELAGRSILMGLSKRMPVGGNGMPLIDVELECDPIRALRRVQTETWSALVVDLHLGHHTINGTTIATILPRIRSLFLVSGHFAEKLEELSESLGADAYYQKPMELSDFDQLADQLCAACGVPRSQA